METLMLTFRYPAEGINIYRVFKEPTHFSNYTLPSLHLLTHLNSTACLPSFHPSTALPISLCFLDFTDPEHFIVSRKTRSYSTP
jgi:hypothetical protein